MKLKTLWKIGAPIILISPMPFIVSCSKSTDTTNYAQILTDAINNGDVKISFNSSNNIKITDLSNLKFKFELNPNIEINEKNEDRYNSIKKSFDKCSIKFVDFLIPKFSDDINSFVIFKINDDQIFVPVKNLYNGNEPISITNLTSNEIKQTINDKLNNNSDFISNLNIKIKNIITAPFLQYIEDQQIEITDLAQSINDFLMNTQLNLEAKDELVEYFSEEYDFFNNTVYKNIHVSDISISSNSNNPKQSVIIFFKISTTPIGQNADSEYLIETPLWI